MSLTPSTMLPLGTPAPDFTLPDPDGKAYSLTEIAKGAKAVLVVFMCNHCPYVKHLQEPLVEFCRDYADKGLVAVAINSNDVEKYPDDSPAEMKKDAEKFNYPFPYLFDETQQVAKAYRAACTPDFFLFNADLKLAYRGQYDGSRPGNDLTITGADMHTAVETVLAGEEVDEVQIPSMGCNIKWKPGNEPDYFK